MSRINTDRRQKLYTVIVLSVCLTECLHWNNYIIHVYLSLDPNKGLSQNPKPSAMDIFWSMRLSCSKASVFSVSVNIVIKTDGICTFRSHPGPQGSEGPWASSLGPGRGGLGLEWTDNDYSFSWRTPHLSDGVLTLMWGCHHGSQSWPIGNNKARDTRSEQLMWSI